MKKSKDTYVQVECQVCKTDLGWVVEDGHRTWWCEKCSGNGKVSHKPPQRPTMGRDGRPRRVV